MKLKPTKEMMQRKKKELSFIGSVNSKARIINYALLLHR